MSIESVSRRRAARLALAGALAGLLGGGGGRALGAEERPSLKGSEDLLARHYLYRQVKPRAGGKGTILRFAFRDRPDAEYLAVYDVMGTLVEVRERNRGVGTWSSRYEPDGVVHELPGQTREYRIDGKTATLEQILSTQGAGGEWSTSSSKMPVRDAYSDESWDDRIARDSRDSPDGPACFPNVDVEFVSASVYQLGRDLRAPAVRSERHGFYTVEGLNLKMSPECAGTPANIQPFYSAIQRSLNEGLACLMRQNMSREAATIAAYLDPALGGSKPLNIQCYDGQNNAMHKAGFDGYATFCRDYDPNREELTRTRATTFKGGAEYVPSVSLNIHGSSAQRISSTFFHEMLHMTGIPHCDQRQGVDMMYACQTCCFGPGDGAGPLPAGDVEQVVQEACRRCGNRLPALERTPQEQCADTQWNMWFQAVQAREPAYTSSTSCTRVICEANWSWKQLPR